VRRTAKGLATLSEFAGNQFEQGVLFYTGQEILPFRHENLTFHALPIGLFLTDKKGVGDN